MNTIEKQGHYFIESGRFSRDLIARAWREVQQGASNDICQALVMAGQLTEKEASDIRALIQTVPMQGPGSSTGSGLAIHGPGTPLPGAPGSGRHSPNSGVFTASVGAGGFAAGAQQRHFQGGFQAGSFDIPSDGGFASPNPAEPPNSVVGGHIQLENIQLGNFMVKDELGRGGMGVVYSGKTLDTEQPVVIKVMSNDKGSMTRVQRFFREARTLAKVKHPNIVRIIDFNTQFAFPYFVMEKVIGKTLQETVDHAVRFGDLPDMNVTASIFRDLASALHECHEAGIVHRDIKPENILIEDGTGRPVLIDFGLVQIEKGQLKQDLDGTQASLTKSSDVLGTPAYMAPELLQEKKDRSVLSSLIDVWSLGGTLYHSLTGRAPYVGASAVNIYKKLMTTDPEPVRKVNPEVPEDLAEICHRCLSRNPSHRMTMEEVVWALEEFMGIKEDDGPAASPIQAAPNIPRLPANWAIWGIWVLVASALVVAFAVAFWPQDEQPPKLSLTVPKDVYTLSNNSKLIHIITRSDAVSLPIEISDDSGSFKLRLNQSLLSEEQLASKTLVLNVKESSQSFDLTAVDAAGNRAHMKLIIDQDRVGPGFQVESVHREKDGAFVIEGPADGDCKIIRLGKKFAEVAEGRYQLRWYPEAHKGLPTLVGRDAVGNETERTVNLVVVSSVRGSGSTNSIKDAIGRLRSAGKLYIMPGLYKEAFAIDKDLTLLGLPLDGKEVVIKNPKSLKSGAQVAISKGARVSMQQLRFDFTDTADKPPILIQCQGRLEVKKCHFNIHVKNHVAAVSFRGEGKTTEQKENIQITDSVFHLSQTQCALLFMNAGGTLKNCQFKDKTQAKDSKTLLLNDRNAIVEAREKSTVIVDGCQFEARATGLASNAESMLRFKNSKILCAYGHGLQAYSKGKIDIHASEIRNTAGHALMLKGLSSATVRACQFHNNGDSSVMPSDIKGPPQAVFSIINASTVEVRKSRFEASAGVIFEAKVSTIIAISCQFVGARNSHFVMHGKRKSRLRGVPGSCLIHIAKCDFEGQQNFVDKVNNFCFLHMNRNHYKGKNRKGVIRFTGRAKGQLLDNLRSHNVKIEAPRKMVSRKWIRDPKKLKEIRKAPDRYQKKN